MDLVQSAPSKFWKLGQNLTEERSIVGLAKPSGRVTKKPRKMLGLARSFYKDLYKRDDVNGTHQDGLLSLIKGGDFSSAEGEVTEEETWRVIKEWGAGKVPGPRGLVYEFFKNFYNYGDPVTFGEVLRPIMTVLVDPVRFGVQIPKIWTTSSISLLYKKGNRTDIKNYRPLSMVESMYKLLTGIINNRLLKPFGNIIGKHQTGFLPGRSYFDNIKEMQCVIDHANEFNKELYSYNSCRELEI
ncbi:hypothetical protein ACN38_g6260 [Penicillium nordicum]|uniref:Uncharacterized protein n=1 Tax=Penicillium nordicum TaxID=229535 RepID=A0A0N0RYR4_9EURO|nr:hypothetical protein ACN38_g6260 [Penicillium nordicum]